MIWIAPSDKDTATAALEKLLSDAADQVRSKTRFFSCHERFEGYYTLV